MVFDGLWLNGSQKVTGVLTMTVQGSTVRIQSRQQTNGYDVDYEGTLAQDGKSIRGSLWVAGAGNRQNWQATIDTAGMSIQPPPPPPPPPAQSSIGRVWQVTEYGGWTATWTRRGDSMVFDGLWLNGSQKVTGVLTMTVQGSTVRIQSRQQTNGYDVDYEGTLAQDGKSIRGSLWVAGAGNRQNWQATIDTAGMSIQPPQPPAAADVFLGDWLGAGHCADPAGELGTFNILFWREGGQILWTDWNVEAISPAEFADEGTRYRLRATGRRPDGALKSYTWYVDKDVKAPLMYGELVHSAYPNCRLVVYKGLTHWLGCHATTSPPAKRPRVE